jgi:hypothetical protein
MPGTDTCIKLGGYLRAEMNFNANGTFNPYRNQDFSAVSKNDEVTRIRGAITVDVRSQTAYGTLRSYVFMGTTNTNGGNNLGGGSSNVAGGSAYDPVFAYSYFMQFAGFTAGKTASFFDFDLQPYSNQTNWFGSNQGGTGQPVFAYTAQFGNGISATISAEDTTSRRMSILDATFVGGTAIAPVTPATVGATGYGGREWPDAVANLRIDQAWGSAQIMGAVHDVRAATGATTDIRKTGYAAGAGLRVNLPMIGRADFIIGQVGYSKGANNYNLSNSGAGGFGAFWLHNNAANGAYGAGFDAVVTADGSLDLTQAWSVTGGYEHRWNPQWKTSLYGAWGEVRYTTAASTAIAGAGTNANWSGWQVGSRTVWTPVENLDLSVEVLYNRIDGANYALPNHEYDFVAGMFRAQRNFWP